MTNSVQSNNVTSVANRTNHPLSERMGVIAALAYNIISGSIFGTFAVMAQSAQERFGVSAKEIAVGLPVVVVGSALFAFIAGFLISRYSLRLLMAIGCALGVVAFLLLAFSNSYAAYLTAYGLLAPTLAISATVGPATLASRWFSRNVGLAFGFVFLPMLVAIMPLLITYIRLQHGVTVSYLLPAALIGGVVLPLVLLLRNFRPVAGVDTNGSGAGFVHDAPDGREFAPVAPLSMPQLLSSTKFWAYSIGGSAIATGVVMLGIVVVPLAMAWGIDRQHVALLVSVMSLLAVVGSLFFGWMADRIGGALGLALLCFDLAILWVLLLLEPGFLAFATILGLIAMHGAGMVPNLGRSLIDAFGAENFPKAFGLATTLNLPLTLAAVMLSSRIFKLTEDFHTAFIAMIALYAFAFLLLILVGRKGRRRA